VSPAGIQSILYCGKISKPDSQHFLSAPGNCVFFDQKTPQAHKKQTTSLAPAAKTANSDGVLHSRRHNQEQFHVARGFPITRLADISPTNAAQPPRAKGKLRMSTKLVGDRSVLDGLHQSGSLRCLFPKSRGGTMDAVLLNTAGGITGGDQFTFSGHLATDTTLTLTTQACERAYKAQPNQTGQIRNRLRVETGARLNWLPQETILFNGSALDRRLNIDLAPGASLLMVEPLVFGRPAMGEVLTDIRFRDRIEIRREDTPIFLDMMALSGNVQAHLDKPFIGNGAGALALVVLVAEDAERHLASLREALPETGGVSLLQQDVLALRLLADDDFTLRKTLLPVLRELHGGDLPRCWMI